MGIGKWMSGKGRQGRRPFGGRFGRRASLESMEPRLLLAAMPTLDAGVPLLVGSSPLTVDGPYSFSTPCVGDWNSDGKKDLLVGQFNYGYVYSFLNQGTATVPALAAGTRVTTVSGPVTTSYG